MESITWIAGFIVIVVTLVIRQLWEIGHWLKKISAAAERIESSLDSIGTAMALIAADLRELKKADDDPDPDHAEPHSERQLVHEREYGLQPGGRKGSNPQRGG